MNDNSYKYLQIRDALIQEIQSMKPHSRLPSRNKLCVKYNVARTTIERAISELIGQGYLYAKDGSGTYVADRLKKVTEDSSVKTLGLIIPDILRHIYPGILRGVEDEAYRLGMNLIISNTDNLYAKQTESLNKLLNLNADGIVIIPAFKGQPDLEPFMKLQETGTPFVFCYRSVEGISAPRVIINNFHGAYSAAKHLVQSGRRRIAFISGPLYSTSSDRYQGYVGALAEAGIEHRDELVIFEQNFGQEGQGVESAKQLMRLPSPPDAFLCFNDGIAKGVYGVLTEMGIRIGEQVSLVGFDNTEICESLPVRLSSVSLPSYELGQQCFKLLLEKMDNRTSPEHRVMVLNPKLITRESSAGGSTGVPVS